MKIKLIDVGVRLEKTTILCMSILLLYYRRRTWALSRDLLLGAI